MATKQQFSSGLVPVAGADGTVVWQQWEYGELVQHLNGDLTLESGTLTDSVALLLKAPGWILLSYLNGWTTSAAGPAAAYYKDALGIVRMRGRITGGASSSTPFSAFPAGYRPRTGVDLYTCNGYDGTTTPRAGFLAVDGSSGNNSLYFAGAGTPEIGLGSISWLAEN